MKTNSVSISRYISLFAIILALTVVALMLPFIFLIPLLFVAVSFGFRVTMLTAFFFGLISLALSYAGGGTFVPLAFIERPMIPIIPRLLVGAVAFQTNALFDKLIKKEGKFKNLFPKAAAAAMGTVTNTFFVIALMYLLLPQSFSYGKDTLRAFTPIMIVSGLIELAINIVVLPPLAYSVNRALKLTKFGEMLKKS